MAKPKIPELFFDCDTKQYWLPINGRFRQVDKKDASLHLIHAGFQDPDRVVDGIKAIDRAYLTAQIDRAVEYAGPLAGHKTGLFTTQSGEKVLVTSEAKPIEAKEGSLKNWEPFLTQLLPDGQWQRFVVWLKFARRSQRRGDMQPGQCLAVLGEPGSGKSWLQQQITNILGGRQCDPYDYMVGKTNFNADLAKAEHWLMEDAVPQISTNARREFGERIKQATVNTFVRIHGKGKEARMYPLFRRMTLTSNAEEENVMRLPPLDVSIVDKLTILKCGKAMLSADWEENKRNFQSELPALAHFVDTFPVPKAWRDDRFGVKAWQHPAVVEILDESSPEHRLMNLIDNIVFKTRDEDTGKKIERPDVVNVTADELERRLRSSAFCFQVEKLLYFSTACGVYLGRLAVQHPSRFEARKLNGKTKWIIRAP